MDFSPSTPACPTILSLGYATPCAVCMTPAPGLRKAPCSMRWASMTGRNPLDSPILHPRSFAPELVGNSFFQIARGIAEQMLGGAVRFKADISLMKPAHIGEATPWHQDEAFQDPAFDYEEVSFWLALQPVNKTNGCMAYFPGTHKGPMCRMVFRVATPEYMPSSASVVSIRAMRSSVRYLLAVASSTTGGRCTGPDPRSTDQERMAYVLIFDRVPTPARAAPRNFPWREQHRTARAQRELSGGGTAAYWCICGGSGTECGSPAFERYCSTCAARPERCGAGDG